MAKFYKRLLVLLLVVCFCAANTLSVVSASTHTNQKDDSLITFDDDYLIEQLDTYRAEMLSNNSELDKYDTETIIEEIINSQLNYIYCFDTFEEGINIFKNNNKYFRELLTRADAGAKLMDLYDGINLYQYDTGIILRYDKFEVLLSQIEILNLFSPDERVQLNDLKSIKAQQKTSIEQNAYEFGLFDVQLLANENNAPYTPNGTVVEYASLFSGQDFTQSEISNIITDDGDKLGYTENVRLGNPSKRYNCHSYAWYSQNTVSNNYWISYPNSYILDNSYVTSTGEENDILCYWAIDYLYVNGALQQVGEAYISHSAIITDVGDDFDFTNADTYSELTVTSKWGQSSLFAHNALHCPYTSVMLIDDEGVYPVYSVPVGYQIYKPFTHESYNLSSSMSDLSISRTVNGSGSITDQYGMYELNVTTACKYTITIQSDDALDNRLYNANMNLTSMTLSESSTGSYTYVANLSTGRYYLRTAYTDTINSGTISIIMKHTHAYDEWTYYTNTTHIESCCCGLTGTATAVHSIKASEVVNNKANCLGCGYMLDLRYDMAVSTPDSAAKVSVNGSYILPSGIIVLVDEDVEAYLNGTLVFYNKDDLPVTQ